VAVVVLAILSAYAQGDPTTPCCQATSSGVWPWEDVTVAVDPETIPLGSAVWIQDVGIRWAEDTGGKIKGPWIDVFFSSVAQAKAFNRVHYGREHEVRLLAGWTKPLRVRAQGGVTRLCMATPMSTGAYTAKHCLEGATTVWVGIEQAQQWSVDPERDLGHIPIASRPRRIRSPQLGEVAQLRGREYGHFAFLGRDQHGQRWCQVGAAAAIRGDSGSGLISQGEALLGIVVLRGWHPSCLGQTIWTVPWKGEAHGR